MDIPIYFQTQDISYRLRSIRQCRKWLSNLCEMEGYEIAEVYITFMSDEGLLGINKQYLDHHFYTDIITFPYQEEGQPLHADIFISTDRAKENARLFKTTFTNEIHRLLTHGFLHLSGYEDHSNEEKKIMRSKEDKYLSLRSNFDLGK